MHEFYEMIAYFLNTVIFMIAGCKLGALLADSSFWHLNQPGSGSLWMTILIYPIVLVARGGAMMLYYPLLKRLGTGCTWKDAIVMWWGGLRGSVGLALGLSIHHMSYDPWMWGEGEDKTTREWGKQLWHPSINCRDQPAMVLMLTLWVVVTTVVVNGITMAPLMKMLKMTSVPQDRVFMLRAPHRRDLNSPTDRCGGVVSSPSLPSPCLALAHTRRRRSVVTPRFSLQVARTRRSTRRPRTPSPESRSSLPIS